jgi:hypothetical protein
MTQTLTVLSPPFVVQASDRLVSFRDPTSRLIVGRERPFNKSVIYRPRDGILSLSFSGLGELEDAPTDSWVASVLAGGSPQAPQGRPGRGIRMGGDIPSYTAAEAMHVLGNRLESVLATAGTEEQLTIVAAGWVDRPNESGDDEARLALFCVRWAEGELRVIEPDLSAVEAGHYGFYASPPLAEATEKQMHGLLGQVSGDWTSDGVERGLDEVMRGIAGDPRRGVSHDFLSVVLRTSTPHVSVRYVPERGLATKEIEEPSTTGWIVGPGLVQPPLRLTPGPGGFFHVNVAGIDVEFTLPETIGAPATAADMRFQGPPTNP